MCRKTFPFLFVLLSMYWGLAQQPALYFEKITTQNGLSNNKVNCIIQDKRGFIWMGTDDGLNRYDGHHFLIFRNQPDDSASISGNIITDILEDDPGILWIATADGGMTRYDYRLPPKQQFRQFRHNPKDSNSIPVNIINAMVQDKAGYIWLASSGASVLRFNRRNGMFEKPVRSGTKTILDLMLDDNGTVWAGRQGGGLLKINSKTLEYQTDPRYSNLYAKLPHAAVTALFIDSRKDIWYGSWDKILYKWDSRLQKELAYNPDSPGNFPGDEILSFAEDESGNIWMGTSRKGLIIWNRNRNQFSNYQHDPSRDGTPADDHINGLLIDRSGTVWLATNKGISTNNPVQQQFAQTFLPLKNDLSENIIYDFYRDENGDLYIGTNQGIFVRRSGETKLVHQTITYKGNNLSVTKFYRDVDGSWFIGTDYSLFRYDPQQAAIIPLPDSGKDQVMSKLIESRVVSIIRDSIDNRPVLIVSPYGHFIAYYDLEQKRWISRLDSTRHIIDSFGLVDNLIHKLYKDRRGQIWLANARDGLGCWMKGAKPRVEYLRNSPQQPGSISNNHVFDIENDSRGNLWISTYGGGLHYFNTTDTRFMHVPGSNNLLEGLRVDKRGNVWMISNGNLDRYDPRSKAYTSFDLPDVEKSGGVHGYIYQSPDGRMYVSGNNYFIEFNPDSVKLVKTTPKVYFTDFKIFNNSYSDLLFHNQIALAYNQNYFTIEFSAPDYSPENIRYSYKLLGVDDDWVNVDTRNFAQYANLPGGKYVFMVRATNNTGTWANEVASIPIQIIPPFWKTVWFYCLCLGLMTLVIYAFYKYRINELVKRQSIRNKIAQDLHDNVGSTLSSVAVYSQVAQIQSEQGNKEGLKDVLRKIAGTSEDMISEMNDIVWTINPRNDSMEKILQRMEAFARPLLTAKEIKLHFHYDDSVVHHTLEMQKRKNFYLIFKEAVNNGVKYSGCNNIYVKISSKHQEMHLNIEDDGLGFDQEATRRNNSHSLSGNGLQNMHIRATEMRGSLAITSKPGNGTRVHLQFPIT